MTLRPLLIMLCATVGLCVAPSTAQAQYKNKALGFDLAYQLISQPSITTGDGNNLTYLAAGDRGDRLHDAIKLGGEGSFKLHHDHWWFNARADLSLLGFGNPSGDSPDAIADRLAGSSMGTNLGLGALAGVRYYFLTDHFRPYLQLSLSYMHIFSFGSLASATCSFTDSGVCDGGTYGDEFLPHSNILAVHAAPSFEFIVYRDVALHLIIDYQRWLVFSGQGNNVFTLGGGIIFYG